MLPWCRTCLLHAWSCLGADLAISIVLLSVLWSADTRCHQVCVLACAGICGGTFFFRAREYRIESSCISLLGNLCVRHTMSTILTLFRTPAKNLVRGVPSRSPQ